VGCTSDIIIIIIIIKHKYIGLVAFNDSVEGKKFFNSFVMRFVNKFVFACFALYRLGQKKNGAMRLAAYVFKAPEL